MPTGSPRPVLTRFMEKVCPIPDSCWIWTGCLEGQGYGHLWVGNRMHPAHRVSYELFKGPISTGLVIDHLCRVHRCVNPAHLEAVTTQENILRGATITAANAAKTHCPKGHEYSPDNTYITPSTGGRNCRTCARDYKIRARDAKGSGQGIRVSGDYDDKGKNQ